MKQNAIKRKLPRRHFLKKSVATILLMNMLCLVLAAPMSVFAEGETTDSTKPASVGTSVIPDVDSLGLEVISAVLIEPTSGQVLLSVNSEEALPPASMTKMMTEYIVADMVKQGKFSWDDVVTAGENAAKTIGSRIFLAEGDQHTIEELYIAMAVGSANDATVALAEHVAGSELAFVKLMNEEAARMGLPTAYFANSTGLDIGDMPEKFRPNSDKETVMSAMDAAILAKYIVVDHPDFAEFTSIQSYKFRERDAKPIINYNWMLEANSSITNFKKYAYPGLDGLKTGHTAKAKYCFAGTAERDGMRLISVVMGAASEPKRFTESKKVLDYGFNNFEVQQVISPKTTVVGAETVTVKKAKETAIPLVTDRDVSFVLPKGADLNNVTYEISIPDEGNLTAPLSQGTKVGTVTYSYNADGISASKSVDLITAQEAEKANWFKLLLRAIGEFFSDLFSGIKNLI